MSQVKQPESGRGIVVDWINSAGDRRPAGGDRKRAASRFRDEALGRRLLQGGRLDLRMKQ
jgi:hypothetical protein